jgi:hypothetical protein
MFSSIYSVLSQYDPLQLAVNCTGNQICLRSTAGECPLRNKSANDVCGHSPRLLVRCEPQLQHPNHISHSLYQTIFDNLHCEISQYVNLQHVTRDSDALTALGLKAHMAIPWIFFFLPFIMIYD